MGTEPIEAVPPAPSPAESSPLSTLAGYPHVLLKAPIKPNFSLLTRIIVHKIIVLRPSEFPPKRSCALTSPWMSRAGLAPAFVLVQRSCAGSHGQCPFPRAGEISSLSLVYDQEQQSKDDLSPPSTSLEKPPQKLLPLADGVAITWLDFGGFRFLHLRSFLVGSQLSLPAIPARVLFPGGATLCWLKPSFTSLENINTPRGKSYGQEGPAALELPQVLSQL